MSFFKFIQSSTSGIVQTFGKYTRTVGPGLRFHLPVIQTITPISHRLHQDTFRFEVKTSDHSFAKLSLAVQYKVEPHNASKFFFSLDDPVQQMNAYIENVVRAKVPHMTLDELFESQDEICEKVSSTVAKKMEEHGITIANTLVTEIEPDAEVKVAMNKMNATERMKEAAKNEADANYTKEIRQAEADRDRKRLQGEGISQQRKAIMKGYQIGIDKMSKHLGLDNKEIINLVINTQHLDTLERIGLSPNAKTLFLNHQPHQLAMDLRHNLTVAKET
jgi:regulator of protease activity HflC (stomatin/prohibitin superfamily)